MKDGKLVNNRYGQGFVYKESVLYKYDSVKFMSTGCLSGTSDILSYISDKLRVDEYSYVFEILSNDEIWGNSAVVVFGCQATNEDLTNTFITLTDAHNRFPNSDIYLGGCMAYRFDTYVPDYVKRIGEIRSNGPIEESSVSMIEWKYRDNDMFKSYYPLKAGVGSKNSSNICAEFRSGYYSSDAFLQVAEFKSAAKLKSYSGIAIICDELSTEQLKDWLTLARRYKIAINLSNVSPVVVRDNTLLLEDAVRDGILQSIHCLIYSLDSDTQAMLGLEQAEVVGAMHTLIVLRKKGIKIAATFVKDTDQYKAGKPIEWIKDTFDSFNTLEIAK